VFPSSGDLVDTYSDNSFYRTQQSHLRKETYPVFETFCFLVLSQFLITENVVEHLKYIFVVHIIFSDVSNMIFPMHATCPGFQPIG
jgi:hypothetical protein